MIILQVLSGQIPFHSYSNYAILYAITVQNKRPAKNPVQSALGEPYEWLWTVAEQCWDANPRKRLTALQVVGYLHPDRKAVRIRLNTRRGFIVVSASAVFFF